MSGLKLLQMTEDYSDYITQPHTLTIFKCSSKNILGSKILLGHIEQFNAE